MCMYAKVRNVMEVRSTFPTWKIFNFIAIVVVVGCSDVIISVAIAAHD